MDSIKINRKQCKVIAHRGLSGIEKENTCPAFVLAGSRSYYGIETDVHVTKDGKYLICHDDSIKKVTGIDLVIEQTNYEDLKKIKILDTDNTSYRSDLVFPDLVDYIRICKKYEKQAVLELKNEMKEANILEIVSIIKEIGWYEHTTFISFSKYNCATLRKHYKDATIQFLTVDANEDTFNFLMDNKVDLDIYYKSLTKEYIDLLHQNNILVNVWTVDTIEEANALIDIGLDYLTSNILE